MGESKVDLGRVLWYGWAMAGGGILKHGAEDSEGHESRELNRKLEI
jgi:hypothetical protein